MHIFRRLARYRDPFLGDLADLVEVSHLDLVLAYQDLFLVLDLDRYWDRYWAF